MVILNHLEVIYFNNLCIPNTDMDPQNDGLEEAFPFNYGLLVSMLVFGGVHYRPHEKKW